jgi:hypothetical protein
MKSSHIAVLIAGTIFSASTLAAEGRIEPQQASEDLIAAQPAQKDRRPGGDFSARGQEDSKDEECD